jgi:hypothetical protein
MSSDVPHPGRSHGDAGNEPLGGADLTHLARLEDPQRPDPRSDEFVREMYTSQQGEAKERMIDRILRGERVLFITPDAERASSLQLYRQGDGSNLMLRVETSQGGGWGESPATYAKIDASSGNIGDIRAQIADIMQHSLPNQQGTPMSASARGGDASPGGADRLREQASQLYDNPDNLVWPSKEPSDAPRDRPKEPSDASQDLPAVRSTSLGPDKPVSDGLLHHLEAGRKIAYESSDGTNIDVQILPDSSMLYWSAAKTDQEGAPQKILTPLDNHHRDSSGRDLRTILEQLKANFHQT